MHMSHYTETVKSYIQYALRILGRRSYSSDMMKRKIQARIKLKNRITPIHHDKEAETPCAEITQEVMDYLIVHKLLDDDAFAKNYIDSMRQQQKSDRWIAQKLMQKGFTRDTISVLLTPIDTFPLIEHHIKHILSFHPDTLTDKKKKEKLIRRLLGKGFKYSDVLKAMDQIQCKRECAV